ncbi:MAG: hypothetical protein CMC76_13130 [Flavobacteriaceae bacterium]|nr:hypothetical protein [Flavobacteriaceae bacterium]
MKLLKTIFLFQKKIIFLAYFISIIIGIIFGLKLNVIGISFFTILPLLHYFFYDIKDKSEYYYYYNLGVSRNKLWLSTLVTGTINFLILVLI